MAEGFASVQRNKINKTPGYKTLFERVTEATGGETRSLSWYRAAVKSEASKYKKDPSRFLRDEKRDELGKTKEKDENMLRHYVKEGHLYMFEYKAKMKWLPYYDANPLVYVIKTSGADSFYGANLHYLSPKKRILATQKLMNGMIDIPRVCIHKYINSHVEGLFLDLSSAEWDTAILLPVEEFVKNVRGHKFPYDHELVWEETNEKFYDKLKGRRIIKGYGKSSDIAMVK
jgi:hypothetical protein